MTKVGANNAKIAKNTLMLYSRLLITMFIGFYTSRVVLQVLGVIDYGIYNLIGGLTLSFAIFSDTLTGSTTRFLTVDLGKKDMLGYRKTFCHAIELYVILAILLFIILETFGVWFVKHGIDIPSSRKDAANITLQFTIVYFIINILRLPFDSVIVSNERMGIYAYIGIAESVLRLINVIILQWVDKIDSLILYVILIDLVSLILLISLATYVFLTFRHCRFSFMWEKHRISRILSFSGWSMVSSITAMSSNQGIDVLLNKFGGVIVNAGMGVANQVASVINNLVLHFQTAFNPQIVKLYASKEYDALYSLAFRGGRFSFYLLLLPVVPIMTELPFYLKFWLGSIPEYTVSYCRFVIVALLFETMSGPLWMLAQANGNIKRYQLYTSLIFLSNFLFSFIYLWINFDIEYVIVIRDIVYFSLLLARIILLNNMIDFPSLKYFRYVVCRCIGVGIMSLIVPVILNNLAFNFKLFPIVVSIISFLWTLIVILFIGVCRQEREFVFGAVLSRIRRLG